MNREPKYRQLCRFSTMAIVLCIGGGLASPVMAGTRAGVDAAISGKYSTNPFNTSNPGAAVVAISPSIAPWLTYQDPNTIVEARADVLIDQYTRVYGTNTNGSASLSLQQFLSSTFTLRVGAGYSNSNVGLHDSLLARTAAASAVIIPGTPLPDVSTAGLRTRTESFSGRVGATVKVSEQDSLTANLSGSLTRSDASRVSDFVNETAYVGFSRQFSQRTSGQISVQYSNVDYLNTGEGDGRIISPQVGMTRQFSEKLHVELGIGASFANFTRRGGLKESFTVLSGNLRLCNAIKNGEICLSGARTAQPTALGGISASSDITLGVDRRFGRSNTFGVTGRYSRVAQTNELSGFKQDFAGLSVSYTRKFNDRFFAFVTPSYSKTFDNIAPREANFEVRAGLRYRFGALQ